MGPLRAADETANQIFGMIWGAPKANFFEVVREQVKQWHPQRHPEWEEKQYYPELVEKFKRFNGVQAEALRKGCDIEVRWMYRGKVREKIAIEIKLDLAESNTITGQLRSYAREYQGIIVVLLGKTKDKVIQRIKMELQEIREQFQIPVALAVKEF